MSDATLNRFFALHVIAIPLVLLGLVVAHLLALHEVGSNNPDGIEIKKHKDANGMPLDGIPFHPYYTVKDIVGVVVFLIVFAIIVFFAPEMGGYFLEYNNFIPADPLKTPPHIAPVWYFTPYYSILRAVPPLFNSQFPGVVAMGVAVMILFLPALAGPQPGEVDPLPRPATTRCALARLRGRVPGARLPRHRADHGVGPVRRLARQRRPRHRGGAHLHGPLLRVLPPDALVHRAIDKTKARSRRG